MRGSNPAVFLDRDGVLNEAVLRHGKPHPPATLDELRISGDARSSLERLRDAGFLLVVVTNQPDIARGIARTQDLLAIHEALREQLPIDEIYVCEHDDPDHCACRKPKPGLLHRAVDELGIDLEHSFLIGDRWRDIDAGSAAGCKTVWIDRDYNERPPRHQPDVRVRSLADAVAWILEQPETSRMRLARLKVKLFADGADKAGMHALLKNPLIKGFTTNPTLMRAAGISNYELFAREILAVITDQPVSFEVFSDEFEEMERQARRIASWGSNVYVKIPVTNTRGEPSYRLIERLSHAGLKVNVTAIMTLKQVRESAAALVDSRGAFVSVFAGRIADTGRDPVPMMSQAVRELAASPMAELIWASPREVLNVFQADAVGCHIITCTSEILKKLSSAGKDLSAFSLETVRMFRNDAIHAGFEL